MGDTGPRSTFVLVHVNGEQVTLEVHRDDAKGGACTPSYAGTLRQMSVGPSDHTPEPVCSINGARFCRLGYALWTGQAGQSRAHSRTTKEMPMPSRVAEPDQTTHKAVTAAIGQLTEAFRQVPSAYTTAAELQGKLAALLANRPLVGAEGTTRSDPLVLQEYPTPFKCQMGDLRFEVLEDGARAERGRYDLVILNPWWVGKVSPEAIKNDDFALFRQEIRDAAQPEDPPLCLVGVEIHVVRTERARLADYSRIRQAYRKLLLSGSLPNGWRFMDHRHMLVYSQHSQPHEAKWRELVQTAWAGDVDPRNVRLAWISPQGTRCSG